MTREEIDTSQYSDLRRRFQELATKDRLTLKERLELEQIRDRRKAIFLEEHGFEFYA